MKQLPHLAVFAKDPDAVPCKTRLAEGLGAPAATEFYRASLARLLRHLAGLSDHFRLVVYLAPTTSCADFGARFGWPHEVRPQACGDLGARLVEAFQAAPAGCVVLGTDVPELQPQHLLAARDALARGAAALGPCPDGGYYLLGAPRCHPELFQAMPWSTPAVLGETRRRLAALNQEVEELEPLADIDYVEDLRSLQGRLGAEGDLAAIVRRALEGHSP